jgi:hypothetical protein
MKQSSNRNLSNTDNIEMLYFHRISSLPGQNSLDVSLPIVRCQDMYYLVPVKVLNAYSPRPAHAGMYS